MPQVVEPVSPKDLRALLAARPEASYTLVDVRQPEEYVQGHIPGALHIPVGMLAGHLASLAPEKDHIFYCKSGARSTAACLLALDSGRLDGRILNLTGGIMAWDGHILPDEPHVAVFDGTADMRGLLLHALEMEKAAHDLYARVLAAGPRTEMCELLERLVGLEMAHAKVVYHHLAPLWDAEPVPAFETLFASLKGEVLEGGRTMHELEPWIRGAATGDCMEVVDLALEVEFSAYDLYRALADQCHMAAEGVAATAPEMLRKMTVDPAQAAEAFLDLARQERKHADLIISSMVAFG